MDHLSFNYFFLFITIKPENIWPIFQISLSKYYMGQFSMDYQSDWLARDGMRAQVFIYVWHSVTAFNSAFFYIAFTGC